ncbi:hypothetical protein ZWY2020_005581 [Hordeum vulgare]|nr:hypothetical protein ZWY2020_005581 [Hordeum vulgare]
MVLRDHNGGIIFSACRSFWSCSDALHAELAGCMEGLALAHQWTQLPVLLKCDSLQAVQMIKATSGDRSQYAMVVNEVKRLMGERECRVTHIARAGNNINHVLANFGRSKDRTMVWIRSGPLNVPNLYRDELLNS